MTEQKESRLITLTVGQEAKLNHFKNLLKAYTNSYVPKVRDEDPPFENYFPSEAKVYEVFSKKATEIKKYLEENPLPREIYSKYVKIAMRKEKYNSDYPKMRWNNLQSSKKALILAEVFEID